MEQKQSSNQKIRVNDVWVGGTIGSELLYDFATMISDYTIEIMLSDILRRNPEMYALITATQYDATQAPD